MISCYSIMTAPVELVRSLVKSTLHNVKGVNVRKNTQLHNILITLLLLVFD